MLFEKEPNKDRYDEFKDIEWPILKPFYGNFKEPTFNVGDYRTLPKGTTVWSIEYQTHIVFEQDEIIEVTHTTVYGDLFFGKLKQIIYQHMFPGLIDKGDGEIETLFSKTTDFKMPEPGIFVQQLIRDQK